MTGITGQEVYAVSGNVHMRLKSEHFVIRKKYLPFWMPALYLFWHIDCFLSSINLKTQSDD